MRSVFNNTRTLHNREMVIWLPLYCRVGVSGAPVCLPLVGTGDLQPPANEQLWSPANHIEEPKGHRGFRDSEQRHGPWSVSSLLAIPERKQISQKS